MILILNQLQNPLMIYKKEVNYNNNLHNIHKYNLKKIHSQKMK